VTINATGKTAQIKMIVRCVRGHTITKVHVKHVTKNLLKTLNVHAYVLAKGTINTMIKKIRYADVEKVVRSHLARSRDERMISKKMFPEAKTLVEIRKNLHRLDGGVTRQPTNNGCHELFPANI